MSRTANNGSTRLHALVWLKYIQSCYPEKSLYFLDVLFGQDGWRRVDCLNQNLTKLKQPKAIGKKPFSRIARTLELPRLYKARGKTTIQEDLPTRTNCRNESSNSLKIFNSKLWALLKAKPNDAKANEKFLNELITDFQITVFTGKQALERGLPGGKRVLIIEGMGELSSEEELAYPVWRGHENAVNDLIKSVLKKSLHDLHLEGEEPLDILALYGALYRKAFHDFDDAKIDVYREFFFRALEDVLRRYDWLGKNLGKKDMPILRDAHKKFRTMLVKMVIFGIHDVQIFLESQLPDITKQELNQFAFMVNPPKFGTYLTL